MKNHHSKAEQDHGYKLILSYLNIAARALPDHVNILYPGSKELQFGEDLALIIYVICEQKRCINKKNKKCFITRFL